MATLNPFQGVLGMQNARHLLGRATFCPSYAQVVTYAQLNVQEAMAKLFAAPNHDAPDPVHPATNNYFVPTARNPSAVAPPGSTFTTYITYTWWLRKAHLDLTAQSKLSFFLHNMFIVNLLSIDIDFDGHVLDYLELLAYYSSRSIKGLAKKMSRCNYMHFYLGNNFNTKYAPNENYAREFLELFTILKGPQDGVGSYTNYTEQDVQMAAKVLTGFTTIDQSERMAYLDTETQIPLGRKDFNQHDTSNKTFSAKFANQTISGASNATDMDRELDEFIDMVFAQPATAINYARRLYRYLVKPEITAEIETDIIAPLAQLLLNNNYDLALAAKTLLSSSHFYDEEDGTTKDNVFGAKVKSPLELFLMMMNQLNILSANPFQYANDCRNFYEFFFANAASLCSMDILAPASVVGYTPVYQSPYDRQWISTTSLKNRYEVFLGGVLYYGGWPSGKFKLDTVDFVRNSGVFSDPSLADQLLDEMLNHLLCTLPTGSRYLYFKEALLGGLSPINWRNEWNNYLSTGNATAVRTGLTRLVSTIIKSREYQVF